MSDELKVEPAVLKQAEAGINAIIGELSGLGIKETGALGRGFSLLALSPLEAGKASVQSTFETFCDRWSWGVRSLVQSANNMAEAVGLAAGRYHMMDQQSQNALKEAYSDLFSDPHLSKDQIDSRSWSETFSDNEFNALAHPDYSDKSFQDMLNHVGTDGQVVKAVGPQALANDQLFKNPLGNDGGAGWNTGAAARAAQILHPDPATPGVEGGQH
ncbi:hypothetical protein [Nocardia sp. NBC_01388]|uniref:hypothetical protein n=1 Tax=Nocardia sp. NBC_01388 TaxID=2903596 RepID=UPI00324711C4